MPFIHNARFYNKQVLLSVIPVKLKLLETVLSKWEVTSFSQTMV